MRAWVLAVVGVAALFSLPVSAHGHYRGVHGARTYVGFGYTYGYPFGYYPFGYYPYAWYSPWGFGPRVGVGLGVRLGRSEPRRERDTGDQGAQKALKLYVYPAAGQTAEQTADDRYQCHVWAVDQSGYDPTLGAGKRDDAESYSRAFTACMEGRNYVVK
jgi:hypothetical protein